MNKHDELTGTFVLVHPELVYDPADKSNKIGIISTASLEDDNVVVSFGKEGQALFSADALLVLRKPNDIHFDAVRDARQLEVNDFKNILQVSLLANSPWTKERRQAVELCRDNPKVLEYSMASLEEELDLKHDYSIGR
ncbi:MAG TPA: hypothetical protein VFE53_23875 [Mucilaginibacter sp.]|jgi:hypothetical protein|nr:hypothetical protein [Mucilaginibacter sp.]